MEGKTPGASSGAKRFYSNFQSLIPIQHLLHLVHGHHGQVAAKQRNNVKNKPKLPASIDKSTQVGIKTNQLEGKKSRLSEATMITNRSNHMPTFTKIATMIISHG